MTTKDDLIAARKLIERPESWGQGDGDAGVKMPPRGKRCAANAVSESTVGEGFKSALRPLFALLPPSPTPQRPIGALVEFNDTHTHPEVLDLFDRAIAACGEDE